MISYDIVISIVAVTLWFGFWLGVAMGRHSTCMKITDYFLAKDLERVTYNDIINALEYAQGKGKL
jgi:hypothetical protein